MDESLKEKIFKLREEGNSYRQIQDKLKCSKSTISYYLGAGQKEKSDLRRKKRRKNPLVKKTEFFKTKVNRFRKKNKRKPDLHFNYKDVENKINGNPVCYLTGRKINLNDGSSYQLDHMVPSSKGGSNEIHNLGLACRDANQAKNDMIFEDFLELCKEILIHNGYNVNKSR